MRLPSWQSLGANHRVLRHGLNIWPPFAAAGIRVEELSEDFRYARVALHLRALNRNYVGTHFGGSLFSMTDPFWMFLVLRNIGRDYLVWDKAAEIDFVSPGRSTVRAEFRLTEDHLDELRAAAADGSRVLRWFETDVLAPDGTVVARVRKQLYVRRKRDVAAD
ncbi:DUF4442 domain-containing protein [Ornithinimicrobium cavernae]|uniref:DUF4442 domain-containing protein n=1 Tax=Ornithinimicrobium cavernae TaxID=2666047 RepID=UPI00192A3D4F|nr:DUF4442 domain-containing protein [Ornithinimicrobium cavernae]